MKKITFRPHQAFSSPRSRSRSFTLLELVLAAALSALVMVGLQSAVLIASKAIPSAALRADFTAQGEALHRLGLDLSYAQQITAATTTGITFTVADRDGDAVEDAICYSWSGVSGEPLSRKLGAFASEVLLEDVRSLSMTLRSETITGIPTYVEAGETLLAIYNPTTNNATVSIDTPSWVAQYVPITLAAGVFDFRTTRVRVLAKKAGGPGGVTTIELRSMRNRAPTTRTLGVATFAKSDLLGSSTWISRPFPSTRYLDPSDQVGLLLRPTDTPPSCDLTYCSAGAPASAGAWCTSTNNGGTWTTTAGAALLYELWGVCRTAEASASTIRATSIIVSVRSGSNSAYELNLPLPNRPVVSP